MYKRGAANWNGDPGFFKKVPGLNNPNWKGDPGMTNSGPVSFRNKNWKGDPGFFRNDGSVRLGENKPYDVTTNVPYEQGPYPTYAPPGDQAVPGPQVTTPDYVAGPKLEQIQNKDGFYITFQPSYSDMYFFGNNAYFPLFVAHRPFEIIEAKIAMYADTTKSLVFNLKKEDYAGNVKTLISNEELKDAYVNYTNKVKTWTPTEFKTVTASRGADGNLAWQFGINDKIFAHTVNDAGGYNPIRFVLNIYCKPLGKGDYR